MVTETTQRGTLLVFKRSSVIEVRVYTEPQIDYALEEDADAEFETRVMWEVLCCFLVHTKLWKGDCVRKKRCGVDYFDDGQCLDCERVLGVVR